MKTIATIEVGKKHQLLDVRLADDYEAAHLEGARNNCVFEVSFESRLEDSAPAKEMATVVYGADGESFEAGMAAEKLERLGYVDVRVLKGGFAEASKDFPVKEGAPLPALPPVPEGRFEVDLKASYLEWSGRNLINKHHGRIGIRKGELLFEAGRLTGGSVVIEMAAMTCLDLEGSELHDVLIDHLKGHDFFDVEVYPTAEVSVKRVEGGQAWIDLTLKGITKEIVIPVEPGLTEEGCPATQAFFSIDRTRWNVFYGSRKLFKRLAGHVVNDRIGIELRLVTAKAPAQSSLLQ